MLLLCQLQRLDLQMFSYLLYLNYYATLFVVLYFISPYINIALLKLSEKGILQHYCPLIAKHNNTTRHEPCDTYKARYTAVLYQGRLLLKLNTLCPNQEYMGYPQQPR